MKIAYIVHPIAGDQKTNLELISHIVRKINLTEPEVVPFVPYYADCVAMNDAIQSERERGIKNNYEILNRMFVNELWVYGNRISAVMKAEIVWAIDNKIPVEIKDARLLTESGIKQYKDILDEYTNYHQ